MQMGCCSKHMKSVPVAWANEKLLVRQNNPGEQGAKRVLWQNRKDRGHYSSLEQWNLPEVSIYEEENKLNDMYYKESALVRKAEAKRWIQNLITNLFCFLTYTTYSIGLQPKTKTVSKERL